MSNGEIIINAIVTLAAVITGAFLALLVENQKNKKKSELLLKNLINEAEDELQQLISDLKRTAETIVHNNYSIDNPELPILKGIGREISLIFLEPAIEYNFSTKPKHYRYALKTLTINIKVYSELHEKIKTTEQTKETREAIHNSQIRYFSTGIHIVNNLRIITGDKKQIVGKSDKEIISHILPELSQELKTHDFLIRSKLATKSITTPKPSTAFSC